MIYSETMISKAFADEQHTLGQSSDATLVYRVQFHVVG